MVCIAQPQTHARVLFANLLRRPSRGEFKLSALGAGDYDLLFAWDTGDRAHAKRLAARWFQRWANEGRLENLQAVVLYSKFIEAVDNEP